MMAFPKKRTITFGFGVESLSMSRPAVEKILILQFKRIGDLILTTPAIRCLREAFPKARITLATGADCAGIVDSIPVDKTWLFHRKAGWSGLLEGGANSWIADGLALSKPDVCLDFDGTDRSGMLAVVSGAKRKVTFERFRRKFPRSLLYSDFAESSVVERHTADHYTDLLRPLGISGENSAIFLQVPRSQLDASERFGPYAVIHAGTARAEKYWQAEKWAAVAEVVQRRYGLACVLTGSLAAEEQSHLAAIKAVSTVPLHDLSGKTTLSELAAVIRGARLFCGVDTAAMHLADAMLTPTVALFGPTNPYHWRPRHTASVVLRADTPEPFTSSQKGGPMEHISSDEVIEAIRGLL